MTNHLIKFALQFIAFAPIVLAEDFRAIDGKEYKNVTVSRIEPDGIVLSTSSGISKVYFTELPKEVRERFHYDAAKSAAYSAQQSANLEALQKQQRQAAEAKAQTNKYAAEQLAADESAKGQRNTVQALQSRLNELQQKEDDLLLRIGEAEQPGSSGRSGRRSYYVRNALADQLPYLRSHLNDVRHDKDEVRKQLEQAQRQR